MMELIKLAPFNKRKSQKKERKIKKGEVTDFEI